MNMNTLPEMDRALFLGGIDLLPDGQWLAWVNRGGEITDLGTAMTAAEASRLCDQDDSSPPSGMTASAISS